MPLELCDFVAALPSIRLKPGAQKRVKSGHPWIFSNEIMFDAAAKTKSPGEIVRIESHDGLYVATACFHPKPIIAGRILSRDPREKIDTAFFINRFQKALGLREAFYPAPYYRLIHAEADGFPGLILDRYEDIVALQMNSAAVEALETPILEALDAVIAPKVVLLRNESAARLQEGLSQTVRFHRGGLSKPVALLENGCVFFADLREGQKTGWFYDQRDNRAFMAHLSQGKTVLDVYSYTGGFAVTAAVAGAEQVISVDRSAPAQALAAQAADRNGVQEKIRFERGDAFAVLEQFGAAKQQFDVVIVDPPAFAKSKKDIQQGQRGYRKLIKRAVPLVKPGGYLFAASCSHYMPLGPFAQQVAGGVTDLHREGRVVLQSGAAPDHPLHPHLPESAYLKAVVMMLD